MGLDCRDGLFLGVGVAGFHDFNELVSVRAQSMENSLTSWQDIVDQLLELTLINLVYSYGTAFQLLH